VENISKRIKGKIYIWDQIILMFTAENFCSNVSLQWNQGTHVGKQQY